MGAFLQHIHVQRPLAVAAVDSLLEYSSRSVAGLLCRLASFLRWTDTNTMMQDRAQTGCSREVHTTHARSGLFWSGCTHPRSALAFGVGGRAMLLSIARALLPAGTVGSPTLFGSAQIGEMGGPLWWGCWCLSERDAGQS